jgi:hypothetical protein
LEANAVGPNEEPRFAPKQAGADQDATGKPPPSRLRGTQLPLFQPLDAQVRQELLSLDTDRLTPMDALQTLTDIVRRLRGNPAPPSQAS